MFGCQLYSNVFRFKEKIMPKKDITIVKRQIFKL